MKQITLNNRTVPASYYPCSGRLLLTWGFYGLAMLLLWRLAGPGAFAHLAVWTAGLAGAAALLLWTEAAE